jgi:hypothetical protein
MRPEGRGRQCNHRGHLRSPPDWAMAFLRKQKNTFISASPDYLDIHTLSESAFQKVNFYFLLSLISCRQGLLYSNSVASFFLHGDISSGPKARPCYICPHEPFVVILTLWVPRALDMSLLP